MKHIAWLVIAFFAVACATHTSKTYNQGATNSTKEVKGRRVEVLFLGDNGHHRPADMVPKIMAALGPKGINFTYTDQLEDLNSETLAKYDALLLFANWDSIAPTQATALLDFVASGKGFIPVHCASYCFRNNDEIVKLIGGQFWRHTWDTIQPVWTKPDHPAIAGTTAFKTLDETYLHTKLQPDNEILTERIIQPDQAKDRPDQAKEPYTWVRRHGKGKIFYTAYGHDERTWSHAGFHDLLEKGILWAINDEAKQALAALAIQPFEYVEANLPNYEQRPGKQMKQLPLSPEESLKHMQIPVDFTIEVFAHEPEVAHPIAFTWDEKGRMFVAITYDYPNERKDTGGRDFILICEDTNGDGKADKFTKFAEGLSVPTGLVFANGGLIVSQAPHMLFLQDTDGDDKADIQKILFSGFGTFDTHAGPSSLHYGFDNWIYGSVGYSGFKGKFGQADSLNFGQALFRFRPDGSNLEMLTRTSNNTWGLSFNEAGDLFASTANNAHGWYMAIPSRYFGKSTVDNGSRSTDTHKDFQPITPKVRQVDVFGGFTAASGHHFYSARAFPKEYWNKVAFVAEPTGHLLHRNILEKKGSDYVDKLGFNFLASADEWVSPVFAQVGPDGALWIADWYSYIIQHNPTPKGFENGSGNAYETDLRDNTHGRIYRVAWNKAPRYEQPQLDTSTPTTLIQNLKNDNLLWRLHAQRLLVERDQTDIVPSLLALVNDQSVDELGLNVGAIHALWTLHGLNAITSLSSNETVAKAIKSALAHPSSAVRKTAIQVLLNDRATTNALIDHQLLADTDATVVVNTLLKLSECPLTQQAEAAILTSLKNSNDTDDRWLPDAYAVVLNAHDGKLRKMLFNDRLQHTDQANSSTHAAPAHHDHSAHATTKSFEAVKGGVDLAITDIEISTDYPMVREYNRITVHITNLGDVAVPKEKIPTVLVTVKGAGLSLGYSSKFLDKGIAPGETITLSEGNNGPWKSTFGFTAEQAGTVEVTATVDTDNVVIEKDEDRNNRLTKKFTVHKPHSLADFALERAFRSYSSYAPINQVVEDLKTAQALSLTTKNVVTKGMLDGWNVKRQGELSKANQGWLLLYYDQAPSSYSSKIERLIQSAGLTNQIKQDPALQTILLKAIREEMKFDKTEFTVKAGQSVEIVFENPDAMQHNIVIGQPNSLEKIGLAADAMITARDAAEKHYVPSLPEVIVATPLVNPNETYKLRFTAPTTPGEYPYVCTFPGHWRLMKGIMIVK